MSAGAAATDGGGAPPPPAATAVSAATTDQQQQQQQRAYIVQLEHTLARVMEQTNTLAPVTERQTALETKVDALAAVMRAFGTHLERTSVDSEKRAAVVDGVLARVEQQLQAQQQHIAQLELSLKRVQSELATAQASSAARDGAGAASVSVLLAQQHKQQSVVAQQALDARVDSALRTLADRSALAVADTEQRLAALVTQRLSAYSPAELMSACERRAVDAVRDVVVAECQTRIAAAVTGAVERAVASANDAATASASNLAREYKREQDSVREHVLALHAKHDALARVVSSAPPPAPPAPVITAAPSIDAGAISELTARLHTQSRTCLAASEAVERKLNALTHDVHTLRSQSTPSAADVVERRVSALAIELNATLQARLSAVQDRCDAKCAAAEKASADAKQAVGVVSELHDKKLAQYKAETAVKFTALATDHTVRDERLSVVEKRIDQLDRSRDVIAACSRGLLELRTTVERHHQRNTGAGGGDSGSASAVDDGGGGGGGEAVRDLRAHVDAQVHAVSHAVKTLAARVNTDVLSHVLETRAALERDLKLQTEAINTVQSAHNELRTRCWTAEQTCARLADDALTRGESLRKRFDDLQAKATEALRAELAAHVSSTQATQQQLRDEFKRREKHMSALVKAIEERVHALAKAVKAALATGAAPSALAAISLSPIKPSSSSSSSASAADAVAVAAGGSGSGAVAEAELKAALALRHEWTSQLRALEQQLSALDAAVTRVRTDTDARVADVTARLTHDLNARVDGITAAHDDKLALVERAVSMHEQTTKRALSAVRDDVNRVRAELSAQIDAAAAASSRALHAVAARGASPPPPPPPPPAAPAATDANHTSVTAAARGPIAAATMTNSRLDALSDECDRVRASLDAAVASLKAEVAATPTPTPAPPATAAAAAQHHSQLYDPLPQQTAAAAATAAGPNGTSASSSSSSSSSAFRREVDRLLASVDAADRLFVPAPAAAAGTSGGDGGGGLDSGGGDDDDAPETDETKLTTRHNNKSAAVLAATGPGGFDPQRVMRGHTGPAARHRSPTKFTARPHHHHHHPVSATTGGAAAAANGKPRPRKPSTAGAASGARPMKWS